MKTNLLSLLAGTALLATVSFAQAGEPVSLSETQMDQVTAGVTIRSVGGNLTFTVGGVLFTQAGPTTVTITP